MIRTFFYAIVFLTFSACTSHLNKVKMVNMEGHKTAFKALRGDSLTVLVWLSADCPISQKQVLTLNLLSRRFSTVHFVGVFTHWDKLADLQRFQRDFGAEFPLVLDRKNTLLRKMKATVTPEAQLLTAEGKVVYQGAIDNWYYAPGRHRSAPNEHYLADAIQAVLLQQPVGIPYTTPVGCRIE